MVVSVNGRPVGSREQLINFVAMSRPGTSINLQIYRDGQPQDVKLTVEEQTPEKMFHFQARKKTRHFWRTGVILVTMNPQIAKQIGVQESTTGAVIVKMSPQGQAAGVRLEAGDIITMINGEKVTSAGQAKELLANAKRNITLNVQRGNLLMTISASAQ